MRVQNILNDVKASKNNDKALLNGIKDANEKLQDQLGLSPNQSAQELSLGGPANAVIQPPDLSQNMDNNDEIVTEIQSKLRFA